MGVAVATCRTILVLKSDRLSPFSSIRTRTRVVPGRDANHPLPESLLSGVKSIRFSESPQSKSTKTPASFGGKLFDFETKKDYLHRPATASNPFRNLRSARGTPQPFGAFDGVSVQMTSVTEAEAVQKDDAYEEDEIMKQEV